MKNFVCFEEAVYTKPFEKTFFRFCRKRQKNLWKYTLLFCWTNLLLFFGIYNREKYLAKRWSFLKETDDLQQRISLFFQKNKKNLWLPQGESILLSSHPSLLFAAFCAEHELGLLANTYSSSKKRFSNFQKITDYLPEEEAFAAAGPHHSKVMKKAAEKQYIYRQKPVSKKKYFWSYALSLVLTYGALICCGIALTLITLYFSATSSPTLDGTFFRFYLSSPLLLFLNALPIFVLLFFFYFLCNNAAVSIALSSVISILLSLINFYKISLRNDPLLVADIFNIMEATNMTESYTITLGTGKILLFLLLAFIVVLCAFLCKAKIKSTRIRLSLFALVCICFAICFKPLYLSKSIYNALTPKDQFYNIYNETEKYRGRGFFYPLFHSVGSAIETPPEGYRQPQVEQALQHYTYTDIAEHKKVHVIAVMLEAYADFTKFEELEFTEDPYEYFHELQKESYNGTLLTDIFAGGTITSERQFLTGYSSLRTFRKPTLSHVWYFKEQGYITEGVHPYHDWFYNRINTNPYLGFDKYSFNNSPFDTLPDGSFAYENRVIFPEILAGLQNAITNNQHYFNFSVSFQGHGPYDTTPADKNFISGSNLDEADFNIINNYLSTIDKVDDSLKMLVDSLRATNEPVVFITFGDHKPWMGNENSVYNALGINLDLATDEGFTNYYETPYLIWANDAAKKVLENDFTGEGPTIGPYFLMNEFFDLAGYVGSEYMQYTSFVKETLPVVHQSEVTYHNGQLLRKLNEQQRKTLAEYTAVQYYRRNHFSLEK